jgi:hypothetical protein
MAFDDNVFINCPYDAEYLPLLRPLVFTVLYAGLNPRLASERLNSGETRISKIVELIRESRYAIHDLSRIQAARKGECFRLNMPFELGLDVGCASFSSELHLREKRCLILEKERYRYQIAISDLSSSDIEAHHNDPVRVVQVVRNWLANEVGRDLPGPSGLYDLFSIFMGENYDRLIAKGFTKEDIRELQIAELIRYMRKWLIATTPNGA